METKSPLIFNMRENQLKFLRQLMKPDGLENFILSAQYEGKCDGGK